MRDSARAIRIVLAEDDPDDQLLTRDAFRDARILNDLDIVGDGEERMDYLLGRGAFANQPPPDLILLDLNMPRKDGRQALTEIKANPDLRRIPVVILTTSKAEKDVLRTYDLGVSSYIAKPVSFDSMVELVSTLGKYWFQLVELPASNRPNR